MVKRAFEYAQESRAVFEKPRPRVVLAEACRLVTTVCGVTTEEGYLNDLAGIQVPFEL